ncbi:MAG: FAD-dependent oxidoreductase [Opitutaceae bacterium]
MKSGKHVLVCGGGIVGLCCAYSLSREGFAVTVVERNAEGADSCAQGSAGYVSPSHVEPISAPGMVWQGLKWMTSSRSPFYIKPRLNLDLMRWGWLFARHCTPEHRLRAAPVLAQHCLESRKLFVELAEKTGNRFEFREEGLFNLCKSPETVAKYEKGLAALANAVGVEARILTPQQVAELEPGARMDIAGAVYFPIDAHLSPRKFMPALVALLQREGVRFHWNTHIQGWRSASGRITSLATSAGDLTADEYVLATGSWAPETIRGLGLRLPMQAGKGYSLTLEQPRFQLKKPMILSERRVAVTPMGTTLRFGGTMEIAGHQDQVRPERVEQIASAAQHYFPDMRTEDFAGVTPWFGYRPVSPDGLPYLGRFSRLGNLTAACGHAMLGVTLAPITGHVVAEVLAGRKPSVDLSLTHPDRFA